MDNNISSVGSSGFQDLWTFVESCSKHVGSWFFSSSQAVVDTVNALIENRGGLAILADHVNTTSQSLCSKVVVEVEKLGLPSDYVLTSVDTIVQNVNSIIENRFGFACLTGLVMVPSQFTCSQAEEANKVINEVSKMENVTIERFHLCINDGNTYVNGIIYYPKNWDQSDDSRCVVYNNPNSITVSGYFEVCDPYLSSFGIQDLSWTPGEILKLAECPIIMYDYRGTGLSSDNVSCNSIAFRSTYESIVVDGEAVLRYALSKFKSVIVAGSSLGGGVATISLDRHIKANPQHVGSVRLLNHDSFSTTPKVILPNCPIANYIGGPLGGLLDAETSMQNLIELGIPITVLCHNNDPVIPTGARMAEFVETLPKKENVSVIYSPEDGHANLSYDMVLKLVEDNNFF